MIGMGYCGLHVFVRVTLNIVTMTQLNTIDNDVSNSTGQWAATVGIKARQKRVQQPRDSLSNSQSRCPVKGSSEDESITRSMGLSGDVATGFCRLASAVECTWRQSIMPFKIE